VYERVPYILYVSHFLFHYNNKGVDEQIPIQQSNLDKLVEVVDSITKGEYNHQDEIKKLNENQKSIISELKRLEDALNNAGIKTEPDSAPAV